MKVRYRKKENSILNKYKGTYLPTYIGNSIWVIDTAQGMECGDLVWILDQFCRDGVHYNYNNKDYPDQPDHAHCFDAVLEAVLYDPESFSMENYLDQYSVQERSFIYNLRDLLLQAKQDKRIYSTEEVASRGPRYYHRELAREEARMKLKYGQK